MTNPDLSYNTGDRLVRDTRSKTSTCTWWAIWSRKLFVDIQFKVLSQYKLLIVKRNLKSTKGCPRTDGQPCANPKMSLSLFYNYIPHWFQQQTYTNPI